MAVTVAGFINFVAGSEGKKNQSVYGGIHKLICGVC
jgi:hypothetical protein